MKLPSVVPQNQAIIAEQFAKMGRAMSAETRG